ncbi:hypothetical protein GE061_018621 [Apolygus lucorum]|uniref:Uncharacterized protein n=1 Tax=Apolygus lucorum TaxID=248454 RepID=A0A8S9XE99_APOLU|nr:hypothetical protein GE061_018621 [Apolygus lucorum]
MSEPGQHSSGAGELEMSGVLGQLERLMRAYNDLAGKKQSHVTQIVPDTDIPRSMFLEIENWDPDEPGALPVTAFFQMFDDVAGTLTQVKKMRLLRAKTKGTAKQFLIDNAQLHAGLNPYDEAREAMLAWFETENPERAAASLCAAKLSLGEGLRQFAERVHRLARSAVKEEGPEMTNLQKQNWIKRKTLKAFIKGLPKELGSLLTSNPPETLETALKRAEGLREMLDLDDDTKWGISAVTVREERRREAMVATHKGPESRQGLTRVALVEVPVAEPGMEVPVAKPGVYVPVAEPGVYVPVAEPALEIPVVKPGVEIPVAKPGMEVLMAKPGVEIPVAKLGVEIPVAKPGVEVLVAKPGVEVPIVKPGVESQSVVGCTPKEDIDPEIEGMVESVGYHVARFPLGDIDFRRIGAILGDDPKETGDNVGEFPIERWGDERWNSHSELKAKIAAHGAGPPRSSGKDSEGSPKGLQEVRPRALSPQEYKPAETEAPHQFTSPPPGFTDSDCLKTSRLQPTLPITDISTGRSDSCKY